MKASAVSTITKSLPIGFSTLVNCSLLATLGYINLFLTKKLQTIEIIYSIDPWKIKQSATYMGYGYNVGIDEDGKITISNTIEACAPHDIVLKTLAPFKFSDNTTEKSFNNFDPTASVGYTLSTIPSVGDGSYLQVYYNDALVKTFSK